MDEYDVIDFIFDLIEPALTGFKGFKDKAEDGQEGNHFVVNSLPWSENDKFLNEGFVNINLFVPLFENGMVRRQVMKAAVRAAKEPLQSIGSTSAAGVYRTIEIIWTETADLKEGFYCKNIKLLVTTQK